MFGNRNGWILSLIILLCTAGLLWALYKRGTEPVAIGPIGRMAPALTLTPPIPPRSVAGWMSEDADATELYRRILADVKANEFAYKDFRGVTTSADYERVRNGLDLLVQARTHRKAVLFADEPARLITNDLTLPVLREQVRGIFDAAHKRARVLQNEQKTAEARQLYEGIFSLGVHLMEERVIYEEWRQGNELLAVTRYLAELAESEAERQKITDFDKQFTAFKVAMVAPVQQFVLAAHPDPERDAVRVSGQVASFETWTADLIELARRSAELTWRVEATLALGRARHRGLTNVDRRAAVVALRDLASDPDPRVRRAAEMGLALTEDELNRMMRHLW
jgi:hypothetical protein